MTRVGYNFFPLTAIMLSIYTIRRLIHNRMTPLVRGFLLALTMIVLDVGIRIGWFSIARTFTGEGEIWNLFMWNSKIYMALFTGPVFLASVLWLLHIMEKLKAAEIAINVAIVTALAYLWALY
ncbi:MAG: hypothetical protein KJN67_05110 [Pontiella sp.]|nr:hypothetical protein [Pontiella sp.]